MLIEVGCNGTSSEMIFQGLHSMEEREYYGERDADELVN